MISWVRSGPEPASVRAPSAVSAAANPGMFSAAGPSAVSGASRVGSGTGSAIGAAVSAFAGSGALSAAGPSAASGAKAVCSSPIMQRPTSSRVAFAGSNSPVMRPS